MTGSTTTAAGTTAKMLWMRERFTALAEHLKEVAKDRQIIYIPNPGNYGDGIIRYGTRLMLSDLGIEPYELNVGYTRVKYQLLPLLLKHKKYHFVYGGGGAWSDAYGFGQSTVEFIAKFTGDFTVLPTTFGKPLDIDKGTLFRRDNAQSAVNAPDAIFCHDMALYAAAREGGTPFIWPKATKSVGLMMRTDHESRFDIDDLDNANEDISLEGDHMAIGPDFLMRVAEYEMIYTDRLHIAIAACIVGRKVKLFTGNYFKIKAIYDSSIHRYFGDLVELMPSDMGPEDIPAPRRTA